MEVQLIIRFPESLAEVVSAALASKAKESLDIKLHPDDDIDVKSNVNEPTRASVKIVDTTYPALIGRLPCNIETHKTFDHVHYFKAGDIGEMIQVFENEEEREFAHFAMCRLHNYERTFPSGITPPTSQIIQRKFLKTRIEKPHSKDIVSATEDEIQKYTTSEDVVEQFEEIVDFEEYMADADHPNGKSFTFDSSTLTNESLIFQNHPEMLLQASDKEMLAMIQDKERKYISQTIGVDVKRNVEGHEAENIQEQEEEEDNDTLKETTSLHDINKDDNAMDMDDIGNYISDSDDDAFLQELEADIQTNKD